MRRNSWVAARISRSTIISDTLLYERRLSFHLSDEFPPQRVSFSLSYCSRVIPYYRFNVSNSARPFCVCQLKYDVNRSPNVFPLGFYGRFLPIIIPSTKAMILAGSLKKINASTGCEPRPTRSYLDASFNWDTKPHVGTEAKFSKIAVCLLSS